LTLVFNYDINIVECVDGLQKVSKDGGAIPPTSTNQV